MGAYTSNNYFYKPALGAFGAVEKGYYDSALDATDLIIKSCANLLTGKSGGQTIVGGTGVTDTLNLQGTSGNGTLTSAGVKILVGNNGVTTALTALNNGNIELGGTLTLGVVGSASGSLLLKGLTSGVVTIKSAAEAGTYSLTLPVNAGSGGYILTTDGSGNLSWGPPVARMSTLFLHMGA